MTELIYQMAVLYGVMLAAIGYGLYTDLRLA